MQNAVAFPDFNFPNPLSGLSSFFNPFTWLNGAVKALANQEVAQIEKTIISPPPAAPYHLVDYLYGNAIGLVGYLSAAITVTLLVITVFRHATAAKFMLSLLVTLLVGALTPFWFLMINWLVGLGTNLGSFAQFYHPNNLISLPSSSNAIGSLIAIGTIMGLGGILTAVFFTYSVVIVAVTFLGLPALVLAPLGERARGFLNWIISIGLTATVFGRFAAIIVLEIAKWLADTIGQGSWFFAVFILIAGLVTALFAQIGVLVILHRQVDKVTGAVKAQVTGRVEAIRQRQDYRPDYSFAQQSARTATGVHREFGHELKEFAVGTALVAGAGLLLGTGIPGSTLVAGAAGNMGRKRGVQPPKKS